MIVFHGTSIESAENKDDLEIVFDNLETGYSDLGAIWFSRSRNVAETFSGYRSADGELQVLIKLDLDLKDAKVFDKKPVGGYVDIDGVEYHVGNDREEFYEHLQREGYDATIIEDNYGPGEDDIAVFNESLYTTISAMVKVGEKWSQEISDEELFESIVSKIMFEEEAELDQGLSL